MAKEMNMEVLVKKLKTVSNTQDSIPMLSLWIIHHKSHHKKIVETWLDMLKKSKNQHRLTLLYLCNDVVQNCIRKKAPIYKESFSDVLAEAVTHLRDPSIKTNVQRVVKIWAKRSIYDTDFTDQLLAALITNRAPEKLRNKLLIEYKTTNLIDEIKKFKVVEDEVAVEQNRLKALRMDISNSDAIRKLKDKIGGEKFSKDFEESASQLEMFLKHYESYIEQRKSLLDLLDHGTVYYHAQYHEAKIVVNAYQNFESRVNKMKRGVDKVKSNFTPLPEEKTVKECDGEDMDISEEDHNNERKSVVIAGDSKSKKVSEKVVDKQGGNLGSGDAPTPATNVLKLLASGLESLKNAEASDSLKKVVSGLVNRPGMRGATYNETSDSSSVKNEISKGSLTIVRSVSTNEKDDEWRSISAKPSSPAIECDSPPSPTGSPELNISSPPRQQSLDSRLADLFSEDGNGDVNRQVGDASESDNDSDSDLIKRANKLLDIKQDNVQRVEPKPDDVLPGLGDLDQITTEPAEEDEALVKLPNDSAAANSEKEPHVPEVKPAEPADVGTTISSFISSSQMIPVIGGVSRIVMPVNDGSSTPTLDEQPYSPPPPSTSVSRGFSARQTTETSFSGDALSFLTNIMGNPLKSAVISSKSNTPPILTPTSVTQPSPLTASNVFAAFSVHSAWPLTNPPLPPTTASNLWSTPPPLPSLPPPPPIFSWPPNPDPTLPPPWQNAASTMPQTVAVSSSLAPPNIVGNAEVNQQPGTLLPPLPSSHITASLHTSNANSDEAWGNLPPTKRSKLDERDTDFRSAPLTSPHRNSVDSDNTTAISEKRNNLITLSSAAEVHKLPAARLPHIEHQFQSISNNRPPSPSTSPSIPPYSSGHISPNRVQRSQSDGGEYPTQRRDNLHQCYDERGSSIAAPELALIHRRIEEARLNSSIDGKRSNQYADVGQKHFDDSPARDLGLPDSENRFSSLRPRLMHPERRHSIDKIIDRELAMIRDEHRREEELLRDVALLDQIDRLVPHPRAWTPRRPRFPIRHPHPRPRMIRPPLIRGSRPRMRF